MQDEAFHEIQLNGKQLVFLFMAATVVAVVIFLCGVMVGRGVQSQLAGTVDAPEQAAVDPTLLPPPAAPTAAAGGNAGASATAQETLTYTERLEEPTPPVETLRAPVEATTATTPEPTPAREATPTPQPVPAVASAPAPLSEPAGNGFVVQVAAVRERSEADVIAKRLATKGYPAFVTTPANGVSVFRVRVGKYDARREAESVAGRLEKEEQFKPWITR